jgi:RNA polymerase sigma-70 factor (ECF subfamily)
MVPDERKAGYPPGSTSSSLLDRARARDDSAWQRLVDLYGPIVYHRARLALDEHAANDVLQEVFRSVAQSLRRFEKQHATGSFRSWLKTITQNKIHDYIRKEKGQPRGMGGSTAQAQLAGIVQVDEEQLSAMSEVDERALLLRRALDMIRDDFEEHSVQAFLRLSDSGLTSREVAEELGMTPAAVRQAKARIMRRLREELGDLFD